ncbi:hypothetical protein [Nocardia cyriacigeorgica]|uniref:hypothetical protein n=1 Tax=Nocardia cyriacigeorgica TaxID=135487 RepID=UPI0024547316|nr:hypothetical protein [Nocardia cyriacigeorgica]
MISNKFRRLFTVTVVAAAVLGTACSAPAAEPAVTPATSVASAAGAPEHRDVGHARLNALVGEWTADKSTYVAGGTPEAPLRGGTQIHIESPDRVVMEIFFTPAGLPELLADRVVLTRRY